MSSLALCNKLKFIFPSKSSSCSCELLLTYFHDKFLGRLKILTDFCLNYLYLPTRNFLTDFKNLQFICSDKYYKIYIIMNVMNYLSMSIQFNGKLMENNKSLVIVEIDKICFDLFGANSWICVSNKHLSVRFSRTYFEVIKKTQEYLRIYVLAGHTFTTIFDEIYWPLQTNCSVRTF